MAHFDVWNLFSECLKGNSGGITRDKLMIHVNFSWQDLNKCNQSVFPPGLTTPSQSFFRPWRSLQVTHRPRVFFLGPGRTWQDRPWPVLFMLAHGNAIWLVWMITTATAGWPAASRNQGHSTSALHTFPALFSSACRWIIHPVQLGGTNLLHTNTNTHSLTHTHPHSLTHSHTKTAYSVYSHNNL